MQNKGQRKFRLFAFGKRIKKDEKCRKKLLTSGAKNGNIDKLSEINPRAIKTE